MPVRMSPEGVNKHTSVIQFTDRKRRPPVVVRRTSGSPTACARLSHPVKAREKCVNAHDCNTPCDALLLWRLRQRAVFVPTRGKPRLQVAAPIPYLMAHFHERKPIAACRAPDRQCAGSYAKYFRGLLIVEQFAAVRKCWGLWGLCVHHLSP